MAQNHSTTKRNRRPKSGRRTDSTGDTMARLKKLATAKTPRSAEPAHSTGSK